MANSSTTFKPGQPATSGTRKGNGSGGAGWGGPSKGAGAKGANDGAGRPPGVKTGEGKQTVAELMAMAGAREAAAQRWMAILNDPDHPKHADMVARAAERLDGAPAQRVEHAGHAFVMFGEREAETAEEWQDNHAPK